MSSIPSDLDELRERLSWCETKSQSLIEQILAVGKQSVKCWLEPSGQNIGTIYAELLAKPPVSLRSEIGMVVNEQRSILDALACALARKNGANNVSDVYFPIVKTEASFDEKPTL